MIVELALRDRCNIVELEFQAAACYTKYIPSGRSGQQLGGTMAAPHFSNNEPKEIKMSINDQIMEIIHQHPEILLKMLRSVLELKAQVSDCQAENEAT